MTNKTNSEQEKTNRLPVHLVISDMHNGLWIKPNRKVPAFHVIGMLHSALAYFGDVTGDIDPEDCELPAFITVMDDWEPNEDAS